MEMIRREFLKESLAALGFMAKYTPFPGSSAFAEICEI